MKNINTRIEDALRGVVLTDPKSVHEAARKIIESGIELSSGNEVAVIDDPSFPCPGQKGKVRGASAKGDGFVDVEFANGTVMPLQKDLLLKL